MGETAIATTQTPRRYNVPKLKKALIYLADNPDATLTAASRHAGYSESCIRSNYLGRKLRKAHIAEEVQQTRANRLDKARGLLKGGAGSLSKAVDKVQDSNDPVLLAEIGVRAMKMGLEYEEKHGEIEDYSPTDRIAALRKGHLRLAYSILRATAVWEPARLLDYLEKVRRELDIDPTTIER